MSAALVTATPCRRCPFRQDVPIYLDRRRRGEIAASLGYGQTFHCHAQIDYSAEDASGESEPDVSHAAMCAGAAKALLAVGGSTNIMRIASRLGVVDLDELEAAGAPCWPLDEWLRLPEGATADDPGEEEEPPEPCATVDAGCEAPAGWLHGGVVVEGTEPAGGACPSCLEPLCSACAGDDGRCPTCIEEDP